MPDDLVAALSRAEFADLIAYLRDPALRRPADPGSGVVGPGRAAPGFHHRDGSPSGLTGADGAGRRPRRPRLRLRADRRASGSSRTGGCSPSRSCALDVDDHWERGLIGVALDPDFARNGFVYVVYVAAAPYPHHRVSRFTADGDRAAPGSEVVLFEGDDQTTLGGKVPAGHQGGAIHFGPDGKLYVGLGEQTAGPPPQRLDSLLGKLLRLNPDGTIPDRQPVLRPQPRGKYRAIWALGCRNPFTFAVQPETGRMLHQRRRWQGRGDQRRRRRRQLRLAGRRARPDRRSPVPRPDPLVPHRLDRRRGFCPTSPAPAASRPITGAILLHGLRQGLDPRARPRTTPPPIPEEFAIGLPRPVDLAFAPDGSLYVLLRDAWVSDRPLPAPHRLAAPGSLRAEVRGDPKRTVDRNPCQSPLFLSARLRNRAPARLRITSGLIYPATR